MIVMILCIVGPSAIGKTDLSIKLAKEYNAIIINADSTQVYKGLNIGTSKITEEEKMGVKHYMFDLVSFEDEYSVADYQKGARKVLEENKDKNIIVVGGTGLYVNALFKDYQFLDKEYDNYENLSNEELYEMALSLDKNVDIHPNNRVRLINFINNKGIVNKGAKDLYDVIYIGLTMPRELIYQRVNKRADIMMEKGLLDEVKLLYDKNKDSKILKRAIGYKELIKYLNNEISLDEAIDLIKKNTRHYVKRQFTWFNHQLKVSWFDMSKKDIYQDIISFIDSLNSK